MKGVLVFERAGRIEVDFKIEAIGARGGEHHGHGSHGHGAHGHAGTAPGRRPTSEALRWRRSRSSATAPGRPSLRSAS